MTFNELGLIEPIKQAIAELGYTTPTPIQEESIPIVLGGYDLLGCAQTGTGKTAAFSIPILQHLHAENKYTYKHVIKALILTPTRELAIQIGESFDDYGKYIPNLRHMVIFGGVGQKDQTDKLQKGIDILIATPGRLLDLINQGFIQLNQIEYFVLDEADRMLDMGFIHDIKKLLPLLPKKRQSLFFSATMPPEIEKLASNILSNPKKVEVTPVSSTVDKIEQSIYFVEKSKKPSLLINLLRNVEIESALIFTRTKYGADKIVRLLAKEQIAAMAIHGNKGQTSRQRALTEFKNKSLRILIATDIAARGIDVDHLSHVINYDLPNIPETYVHRIGRTGRAGRDGIAISFCDVEEFAYLKDIQKLIGKQIEVAGGNPYETAEVKEAIEQRKADIKEQSKRRNMFGSKRNGSFWRNKKRAESAESNEKPKKEVVHSEKSKSQNKPSFRGRTRQGR